jgi:hypothetical protein
MRKLVVVAVTFVLLALPPAVSATHTANCNSGSFPAKSGHLVNFFGVDGVRAALGTQSLDPCIGYTSDSDAVSFVWIGVQDRDGATDDEIVQLGVGRCHKNSGDCALAGAQTMGYWWAWGREPDDPACVALIPRMPNAVRLGNMGASANFIGQRSGGFWRGYIAGSQRASVDQDEICWTPDQAVWFAEGHDAGDAVGGSNTTRFALSGARYQKDVGGSLFLPGWTAGNCPGSAAPYFCTVPNTVNDDGLSLWTNR